VSNTIASCIMVPVGTFITALAALTTVSCARSAVSQQHNPSPMDVVASQPNLNPVVDVASIMTEAEIKWSQRVRTRQWSRFTQISHARVTLSSSGCVVTQLQLAVSELVEFLSDECQTCSFKRTAPLSKNAKSSVDFVADENETECKIHLFQFIEDPQYDQSLKDVMKGMPFPIKIYVHAANQVMKREEAVRSLEEFSSLVDTLKAKAISVWESVDE
jgi:hypothetical protein